MTFSAASMFRQVTLAPGQQGRVSLDFRLREAGEIKDHVVRTLIHLSTALRDGSRLRD